MTASSSAQNATIPAPPDFPFTWEQPGDEQLFWTMDRMHAPEPITPMADGLSRIVYERGFAIAAEYFALPMRMVARRFGTYHYNASVPTAAAGDPAAERLAEERLGAAMARIARAWEDESLPTIRRVIEGLAATDLAALTPEALLDHADRAFAEVGELWEIHFRTVLPAYMAMSLFEDLYRDLFPGSTALDTYRLLQGYPNQTVELGAALWALAQRARAVPEVRQVLETTAVGEVVPALERSAAGRAFLADLQAYLETYGKRCSNFFDLASPAWIEDPTPVIKNLKDFVSGEDRDPERTRQEMAAERDAAIAEARARLSGYPAPVREQFEQILRAGSEGIVVSEDHNFWIDFRSTYEVRRILLEVGRRFADAGLIDTRDDIFFLRPEELRAVWARALNARPLVAERRAEMEYFRTVTPPPALGTPPAAPPPDNPFTRSLMVKFFNVGEPPAPEPGILRGAPGSAGVARGPVRIVRSFEETARIQPGDVLVADTTAPPWTPLFATVAAVVTDTGGVLSHSAVVAREYRLPAVVGTTDATARLRDGQMVEVDGTAGIVRLLDAG